MCYTKFTLKWVLCYMVVASYLHIYGCAIRLPENVTIPAILVFGDSIVDAGNNNYIPTIAKVDFPPYGRDFEGGIPTGRFSNGRIPSDLIAEALGIKELVPPYLDPTLEISDLLTGVTFASGAAGYDVESAKSSNAMTLDDQLQLFRGYINQLKSSVGENTTNSIISQSMYLVFAGSNDITNTYFTLPFRRLHYDVPSYTTLMVTWASTFIQELYSLGARRIGVVSAPPSGCLPLQRTLSGGLLRECGEEKNQAAILYNNKLYSALSNLNQELSGSIIVPIDIYNPLLNLIQNPSKYGFEVADRGCCGTGMMEVVFLCNELDPGTCPDASKYVFWDSYHPTETAYRIIVDELVDKGFSKLFG